MPLEVAPLFFFDVETTGLRPDRGARIVELALLGEQGVCLHWHGLKTQRLPRRYFLQLFEYFRKGVIIGHNLHFDFWFVAYEAGRLGVEMPVVRFIDTLSLARRLLPGLTDYRLASLLDALNRMPAGTLHTAMADARAGRILFWELVARGKLCTLADAGMKQMVWSCS